MSFYIINKIHHGDGFFAKFNHVLFHLVEGDNLNLTPYVDFKNIKSNLHDYTNLKIENEWEYCFEQNYNIDDVYKSPHVMSSGLFLGWYPAQGKNFRDKHLTSKLHNVYSKYVKIKPEILNRVELEIDNYRVLAVHCRRSDMVRDHANIGLNYSEDTFLQKTLKIFNDGNFEKIYLATEEIDILNYFLD